MDKCIYLTTKYPFTSFGGEYDLHKIVWSFSLFPYNWLFFFNLAVKTITITLMMDFNLRFSFYLKHVATPSEYNRWMTQLSVSSYIITTSFRYVLFRYVFVCYFLNLFVASKLPFFPVLLGEVLIWINYTKIYHP